MDAVDEAPRAGGIESVLPDLRGIPLDQMEGDPELADIVARYLPRLQADIPVSSFNSSI